MASTKAKPAARKTPARKASSGPAKVIVLPAPQRLPESQSAFEQKSLVDRIHSVLNKLEDQAEQYGKVIARLQKRKAIAFARAERISAEVVSRMGEKQLDSVAGWHIGFERRQAPVSVEVVDERLLPVVYLRTKEVSSPDKHAIREAIQRHVTVPGARLVQRFTLLRK